MTLLTPSPNILPIGPKNPAFFAFSKLILPAATSSKKLVNTSSASWLAVLVVILVYASGFAFLVYSNIIFDKSVKASGLLVNASVNMVWPISCIPVCCLPFATEFCLETKTL